MRLLSLPNPTKLTKADAASVIEGLEPSEVTEELLLLPLMAQYEGGDVSFGKPKYSLIAVKQMIAMAIAHVEAFISDTVRTICAIQPNVLHETKAVSSKTVLTSQSREEILAVMADDYAMQIAIKGTIREKLQSLSKHGIETQNSESDRTILDEAESIRNVILHNGGKVSNEFLRRTGRNELKLGEDVPLSMTSAIPYVGAALSTLNSLYAAVALKFFDVPEARRQKLTEMRTGFVTSGVGAPKV
jgi:hypothetical protein